MAPQKRPFSNSEYVSPGEVLRDAVCLCQGQEDAEHLNAIRSRIRRSLDDPRPDLTGNEVQANLDAMFAEAEVAGQLSDGGPPGRSA